MKKNPTPSGAVVKRGALGTSKEHLQRSLGTKSSWMGMALPGVNQGRRRGLGQAKARRRQQWSWDPIADSRSRRTSLASTAVSGRCRGLDQARRPGVNSSPRTSSWNRSSQISRRQQQPQDAVPEPAKPVRRPAAHAESDELLWTILMGDPDASSIWIPLPTFQFNPDFDFCTAISMASIVPWNLVDSPGGYLNARALRGYLIGGI